MPRIAHFAFLVRDYDEAIAWFTGKLDFALVEDTDLCAANRWVRVAPKGGGRVFLFLETDDFARDHAAFAARGVKFVREPKTEAYGTVAVFEDLYGNLWDLLQSRAP